MVLTGLRVSGSRSLAGKGPLIGRKVPSASRSFVTQRYEDADGVGSFVCAQGSVVGAPLR